MTVEPVDALGTVLLALGARGITHPMLGGWLMTPNATFGGRKPVSAWDDEPELVTDLARLAAQRDFRRRPRA